MIRHEHIAWKIKTYRLIAPTLTVGDLLMTKLLSNSVANFSNISDENHIRPRDCAQLLGISIATFWRLCSSGRLKTHKLTERTTTVRAGDLRAFMAGKVEG